MLLNNRLEQNKKAKHFITFSNSYKWVDAIALRNVRWRDIDSVFYNEKTRKFEINKLCQLEKIFFN